MNRHEPITDSVKVKRDYLTEDEVTILIDRVKKDARHGQRNALILLMMYRHGLRSIELVNLTWDQVDFKSGCLLVYRKKNGLPSRQPMSGEETRQLRRVYRERSSAYIFTSERGGPMTTSNLRMIFSRLRDRGDSALLSGPIHAHALRHACGHKLADQGIDTRRIQDYLGHKSIQNTQRYTELSSTKFKGFDKLI